jgi:predicted AlkP superfamily phosphohydrolase/phosphomutase
MGKQSIVLNVPQTYPVQSLNGHLVSCFLTPNTGAQFAYPAIFKQEVLKHFPDYAFDVRDFRNVERAELYQAIIDVTNSQYELLEYALKNKAWDFAMHVNIGVDRMHHAFWRYHDPQHRLHEPESPFRHAIRDYYKLVDSWLARILPFAEDAAILVVSDHGAKRMDGAIAINEWLWQNGWLTLKENPTELSKFDISMIDWSRTRAWSTGGYYGRIFLNVEGREAQGIIPRQDYETVRDDLAARIAAIPDEKGQALKNQVFKPEAVYQSVKGAAPDLMVYFGDLHWRCVGGIGYGQHTTFENDTGPDDANHAQEGMFILYQPKKQGRGQSEAYQLMDVAPTVLSLMGLPVPKLMQGKVMS